LLREIDRFTGQPVTKAALQLIALLVPRPGELRMAEWQEFDLQKALWVIPAARAKMRREHRVPLPRQALAILTNLHSLTGKNRSGLAFPGLRTVDRPLSENTLNAALRRMGFGQDEMCAHGFRATFSTIANEHGQFSASAIETALAHQDADAVRRAYARGQYWDERVRLMTWWADHCDAIRAGTI
jgi:integrase